MTRVYIAGPYSAPSVWEGLMNMNRGMRTALWALKHGMSPFCPFFDYHFFLQLGEGEFLSVKQMKDYSMDWLEVSGAVLVLEGWEHSDGTKAEILRAKDLDIPVFYTREDLMGWVMKEAGG